MADTKISEETPAAALTGAELIALVQDSGNVRSNVEDVAAFGNKLKPVYVAGNWIILSSGTFTNGVSSAMSADTIYFSPISIERAISIEELGFRKRANVAGGAAQLAIYASDPTTRLPTGDALASTSGFSLEGAANFDQTAALSGGAIALQPGLYWAAMNTSASGIQFNYVFGCDLMNRYIGGASASNVLGDSYNGLSVAGGYGVWPDLSAASFSFAARANFLLAAKVTALA